MLRPLSKYPDGIVPADEFYIDLCTDDTPVVAGFNSDGVYLNPAVVDSSTLVPTNAIRVVGTYQNAPIILSAGDKYDVPVEVCSPALLNGCEIRGGNAFGVLAQLTRNMSRALPEGDARGFVQLSEADKCAWALFYNFINERVTSFNIKFNEQEGFRVPARYNDYLYIKASHVMGDLFSDDKPAVVDFCACVIDPVLWLDQRGRIDYVDLSIIFGFRSLEFAVKTAMLLKQYFGKRLPYDHEELETSLAKTSEHRYDISPVGIIGLKYIHGVLSIPAAELPFEVSAVGGTVQRGVDTLRRYTVHLLNEWMTRKFGDRWVRDDLSDVVFEVVDQEGPFNG